MTIREIMSPTADFPRIPEHATFFDAVLAMDAAQEAFLSGKAKQRILLVEDSQGNVTGKITPMDVLRGLEPKYDKIEGSNIIARFGLAYAAETMKEEYRLWQTPLAELCSKAQSLKVADFQNTPSPSHTVAVGDSMEKVLHRFVLARHDSLFVKEGDKIIGLLRFSDVYKAVSRALKECRL
jgi:predicted transcriptional regulator